jgi:hypothetical protein
MKSGLCSKGGDHSFSLIGPFSPEVDFDRDDTVADLSN